MTAGLPSAPSGRPCCTRRCRSDRDSRDRIPGRDGATLSLAAPPDAPDAAVRSSGLTKRFGSHLAVDGIDLLIPRGAVYGFLGPNGSGKTTTIRMLLGLVRPTAGTADLLGRRMPERSAVLHRVGALVEVPPFPPSLSGRRNLARLDAADPLGERRSSVHRIDAALDRVGLLP